MKDKKAQLLQQASIILGHKSHVRNSKQCSKKDKANEWVVVSVVLNGIKTKANLRLDWFPDHSSKTMASANHLQSMQASSSNNISMKRLKIIFARKSHADDNWLMSQLSQRLLVINDRICSFACFCG